MGDFKREKGKFGGRSKDRGRSGRGRKFFRESPEDSDRSGPRRRPGRSRRDSGKLDMHEVICDKCGKECEVPFKPTSSKPVYCSDCFKKNDGGKGRRGSPSVDLTEINYKLDRILSILEGE